MNMGRKKISKVDKVRNYIAKHPDDKPAAIAAGTGIDVRYVYNILAMEKKRDTQIAKRRGRPPKVTGDTAFAIASGRIVNISTSNTPISPKLVTGISGKQYEAMDFSCPPPPSIFARISQRIKKLFSGAPR
jgi:hypothetical protein